MELYEALLEHERVIRVIVNVYTVEAWWILNGAVKITKITNINTVS